MVSPATLHKTGNLPAPIGPSAPASAPGSLPPPDGNVTVNTNPIGTSATPSSLPVPNATPFEQPPVKSMYSDLMSVQMILLKSSQATRHFFLKNSFDEQNNSWDLAKLANEQEMKSVKANYQAARDTAIGDMVAGAGQALIVSKSGKDLYGSKKAGGAAEQASKQAQKVRDASTLAGKKLEHETGRLQKRMDNLQELEKSEGKLTSSRADLKKLEDDRASVQAKRDDAHAKFESQIDKSNELMAHGKHAEAQVHKDLAHDFKLKRSQHDHELRRLDKAIDVKKSEVDADTVQRDKVQADGETLRPEDVRNAEAKLPALRRERDEVQKKFDEVRDNDGPVAAQLKHGAELNDKLKAVKLQERTLSEKVAGTGWVHKDDETVDGLDKQIKEKHDAHQAHKQGAMADIGNAEKDVQKGNAQADWLTKTSMAWNQLSNSVATGGRAIFSLQAAPEQMEGGASKADSDLTKAAQEQASTTSQRSLTFYNTQVDNMAKVLSSLDDAFRARSQTSVDIAKNTA